MWCQTAKPPVPVAVVAPTADVAGLRWVDVLLAAELAGGHQFSPGAISARRSFIDSASRLAGLFGGFAGVDGGDHVDSPLSSLASRISGSVHRDFAKPSSPGNRVVSVTFIS